VSNASSAAKLVVHEREYKFAHYHGELSRDSKEREDIIALSFDILQNLLLANVHVMQEIFFISGTSSSGPVISKYLTGKTMMVLPTVTVGK
jgi:hypothetical protein